MCCSLCTFAPVVGAEKSDARYSQALLTSAFRVRLSDAERACSLRQRPHVFYSYMQMPPAKRMLDEFVLIINPTIVFVVSADSPFVQSWYAAVFVKRRPKMSVGNFVDVQFGVVILVW